MALSAPDTKMDDEVIDLHDLVSVLWFRRWWIVAGTGIFAIAATIAFFVTTPIYRTTAVLIAASPERNSLGGTLSSALGQLGGLATLAGASLGSGDAATEESLAVLRSRQFIGQFITDFDLLPVLFSEKWDSQNKRWKANIWKVPTVGRAVKYFAKKIESIGQDKKTGLITLVIDWKDRNGAAEWTNTLVQRLNLEMRRREIEKADASVKYLEKELETTSVVETRQAINRLIESQVRQRMLANVTQEYAFRVVDKAIAPDADDPIKPQKLLYFVGGPLLGVVMSVALVLAFGFLRRTK
jgi:uncharacterized protein involved in exopolysaccharide biosynthesis